MNTVKDKTVTTVLNYSQYYISKGKKRKKIGSYTIIHPLTSLQYYL
jgi:hypothetical protein